MRKIIIATTLMISVIALYGCSIFTPYKESFICTVPEGKGYCGSLSDGYEYSVNFGK